MLGPVLGGGVTALLKVYRPVHQVCLIIISFLSDSSSERIERRGRVSDRLIAGAAFLVPVLLFVSSMTMGLCCSEKQTESFGMLTSWKKVS